MKQNPSLTPICQRGYDVAYEDLMSLIDLTFGFKTPETQFLGLLPKCYKPAYRPQDSNYVVISDEKPVAAVGAYDHEVVIAGYRISCRGIGNVAVHPEHREKGYMKLCMETALEDMIKDGIALSTLGGRRQRYRYFSYDKCGICHTFVLTADNLRHTYGTLDAPFAAKAIDNPDDPLLDKIKALSDAGRVSPVRSRAMFLDIAVNWHAVLYAVVDPTEDRFVGYAIVEPGGFITEVRSVNDTDIMPLLRTLFSVIGQGSITLRLPDHETAALAAVAPVAEGVQTGCSMSYTVLRYALVLQATLALKASYTPLADGTMNLLIHGRAGDEYIEISVRDQRPTVRTVSSEIRPDVEWSHLDAMNILFAPFSPLRNSRTDMPNGWFPLPIWMYRADEV